MTLDSPNYFTKDPQAILDYTVNWGDNWLGSDTIATGTWIITPTGLKKVSETYDDDKCVVWVSSGTVGQTYYLTNRITTAAGRTDERTISIMVKQK